MPGNDQSFFAAAAQQYMPIATGMPMNPMSGMESIPGMMNHPILGMLAMPAIASYMGGSHYAPMTPGINVYDALQHQRMWQMQMELQQMSAVQDRESYMRTARGLAAMTGTPWGAEQMRAAGAVADFGVGASPFAQMLFPDLFDELAGPRGSGAVMAGRMMMAGRYRMDPVTGRMGMDPATVRDQAAMLFHSDMFNNATGAQGFRAGQIGDLSAQLFYRGMLGSTGGEDVNRLGDPTDPAVATKLRSLDTMRVKQSLQSYLGAVNAVRDIFGEMGQPNAPMSELINGLQALTNGAMSQLQPGQLKTMVRMTSQLANTTGVTLDSALMVQGNASVRAQQLGIEPVFAVGATQGSLAFAGAYRAMNGGATPAWGKMSVDQLQQLDANLRVSAAGSRATQRIGVALRLNEMEGGFDPNSDAGKYMAALRSSGDTGLTAWTDSAGVSHGLSMSQAEFYRTFTGVKGITSGDITGMMDDRSLNRAAAMPYVDVVRRSQGAADINPRLADALNAYLPAQLRAAGMSADAARAAAAGASGDIIQKIMNLSPDEMASDSRRQAAIAGIMKTEFGSQLKNGADYNKLAVLSYDNLERFVERNPNLRGYGSLLNIHALNNPAFLDQANRTEVLERFNAGVRDVVAPLNRGGIAQRLIGYLQQVGAPGSEDKANLSGLISSVIGVDEGAVKSDLIPVMQNIKAGQDHINDLETQYSHAKPADREKISTEIRDATKTLGDQVAAFTHATARLKINDNDLTLQDVNRTTNLGTLMTRYRRQVGQQRQKGNFDFADFWNSDQGRQFHETARAYMQGTEDVATKTIMSDATLRHVGIKGLDAAQHIQATNTRLLELAQRYTGGDIGRLIAGDYKGHQDAKDEVAAAYASQYVAMANLGDLQKQHVANLHPTNFSMTGDTRLGIATAIAREGVNMTGMEVAKHFLSAYGVVSKGTNADQTALSHLASLSESQEGRKLMLDLTRGQTDLAHIGRGLVSGASHMTNVQVVDSMYADYGKMQSGDFIKRYGKKAYDEMGTQISSGFIQFGVGGLGPRIYDSIGKAGDIFSHKVLSGEIGGHPAMGEGKGSGFPDTLTLKGVLDLKNGEITASAKPSAQGVNHAEHAGGSA